MNPEQKLTKYSNALNPTSEQEEKIYRKVFGKMPVPHYPLLDLRSVFFFLNFRFISYLTFILVFLTLPIGVVSIGVPNKTNEQNGAYQLDEAMPIQDGDGSLTNRSSEMIVPEVVAIEEDENESLTFEDTQKAMREKVDRAYLLSGEIKAKSKDIQNDIYVIETIAEEFGGFVLSSEFKTDENQTAVIILKQPVEQFSQTVEGINNIDVEIIYQNISAYDQVSALNQLYYVNQQLTEQIFSLEHLLLSDSEEERDEYRQQVDSFRSQQEFNSLILEDIQGNDGFSTLKIELTQVDKEPTP